VPEHPDRDAAVPGEFPDRCGLVKATKDLLDWAAGQGLTWDMSPTEGGEQRGCRLAFRLAG
jgi:hypothetical protein